jgi:hypothetical protein
MPYGDLKRFRSLADLRDALIELEAATGGGDGDDRDYRLCCCALYTSRHPLGRLLSHHIARTWEYFDTLTGDTSLVFAVDPRSSMEGGADQAVLTVAHHLDVNVDALPCAVFFLPDSRGKRHTVLRLADYIPKREDGYGIDDVDSALHVIATASTRCIREPEEKRLAVLRQELIDRREHAFPTQNVMGSSAVDVRENLTTGSTVLTALATAGKLALGIP